MTGSTDGNFAGRLVERLGRNAFLVDAATGSTISADALPWRIAASGTALVSAGLRPGNRLLIGCTLSPPSALVYLGAIYAGLVAVPVEERVLTHSAKMLLEATSAEAVWTEAGLGDGRNCPENVISLKGDLAAGITRVVPPAPRMGTDLASLMATSGSTGAPRFVMVSHRNLLANTEAIIRSQRLGDDERAMMILPVSYCFGASLLHTHLYQGGGVVFDRRFMFPDTVLHATAHYGCTTFAGVPTVYNVLLRRSSVRRIEMPNLKRFLQAGGALATAKIAEMRKNYPHADFYVMYGQTEATARISCMEPERWEDKQGSVGRPLDNLRVAIVDERGHDVPAGYVGELRVKGFSVCTAYWNDPEETGRVFSDGWLNTGDLARQDEEGYLWIEGRKGAFLKMRGIRVSFAEVEERVAAVPGVYECAALAVEHPEAGEALVLYIVPDRGARLEVEEIRRHLPAQWALDSVHAISELPRNSAGKIARASLVALGKEHPCCSSTTK